MDQYYTEVLRDEGNDKLGNFCLPSSHTQRWDPQATDMMYMAISFLCLPFLPLSLVLVLID